MSRPLRGMVPAPPKLNKLITYGPKDDLALGMPVALVRSWQGDSEFGSDFNKWVEKFAETQAVARQR